MKNYLFGFLASFAFISPSYAFFWGTTTLKTQDGGYIEVKKENITCRKTDRRKVWDSNASNRLSTGWNSNTLYSCEAYGVKTDLVGYSRVINGSANCGRYANGDDWWVCAAAQNFGLYPFRKIKAFKWVMSYCPENVNRYPGERKPRASRDEIDINCETR